MVNIEMRPKIHGTLLINIHTAPIALVNEEIDHSSVVMHDFGVLKLLSQT